MKTNIVKLTDSYKLNHWGQYPKGIENVYSYFEARKGAHFPVTVFFGLQYLIKEYLEGQLFDDKDIDLAEEFCQDHFGTNTMFNRGMWEHILLAYGGKLPISIKAIPEGTPVSNNNVLMTVENTDSVCAPLTNHLETLLCQVWHPSTVATLSYITKQTMKQYLERTSDNPNAVNFQLHDFGFRGVSSVESAALGGAGHLVNFMGTDTTIAIDLLMQYYNSKVCAYSVPATEHSVMTAEGEEGEKALLGRLLDQYDHGILSIVSDSYDITRFVRDYVGKTYKEKILARDGKVVIRPDSLRFPEDTPEDQMVWILEELWKVFGGSENSKGYRVLNPKVGALWGDGIDYTGISKILDKTKRAGFSTEALVFGMGGGLLQKINRDNQRFAFKCSANKIDGVWRNIWKKPLDASKISKKGRLKLIKEESYHNWKFSTVPESDPRQDELVEVFRNGEMLVEYDLDEVRARANDLKYWFV